MKKILIVEDDLSIRESLNELLENEGYQVYLAEHGQKALTFLADDVKPNAILLDLSMPIMDGKTFLKEIRHQFPALKDIPIIIMTAAGAGELPRPYNNDLILRKPLDVDVLMSKLESVML